MNLPDKIADFTVLPLLYSGSTQHALYLREHVAKSRAENDISLPHGRTLFVVNIPPDATEREFTLFFKNCGHVERVLIQRDAWSPETYGPLENSEDEDEEEGGEEGVVDEAAVAHVKSDNAAPRLKKQTISKKKKKDNHPPPQVTPLPQPELPLRTYHHTGSAAHVVFTDAVSISHALALRSLSPDQRVWPPATSTIPPSGLTHYATLHCAQRPLLSDVKIHADTFLEVYEYNKALLKQISEYRKGEAIVDEDGFTLVTRGGAYGMTLGGGVGVASKRFMKDTEKSQDTRSGKRGKKKPKKHEKEGFYKFQLHEQKRKDLVDLKANFEKDKEKIAQLRESRRFKPY